MIFRKSKTPSKEDNVIREVEPEVLTQIRRNTYAFLSMNGREKVAYNITDITAEYHGDDKIRIKVTLHNPKYFIGRNGDYIREYSSYMGKLFNKRINCDTVHRNLYE